MKQDTLEGRAKTKNGVIRLCFSVLCILLEAAFIIIVITRLNEYAEIVNLLTRVFAGILVLALYGIRSDLFHENAVDHSDTCVSDHGCSTVSADRIKWRNP